MADEIELNLRANIDDALKSIKTFGDQSSKALGSIESGFGAIKAAAVAAIGIVAGREVVQFFKDGIDAAIAQEQALTKLQTQLEQTGEASDEATKTFVDLADEMERTTKFEDDAILSAAALAKSFGVSNEQAVKLTKAAAELAAVTGKDLDSAVQELGKTFSGSTGKLEKQIPALNNLTKAQLAAGEALDIVLERFGGAAEAEIKTFAGSIGQAEKAFGNLQESFGGVVTQNATVLAAINAITKGLNLLQQYVDENRDSVNEFVTQGLKVFATSISVSVDAVGYLIKGFEALTLAGAYALTGLSEIAGFFANVWKSTIGTAANAFFEFLETVTGALKYIPGVSEAFSKMGIDVDGAAQAIGGFRKDFNGTVDAGIEGIKQFGEGTSQFADGARVKFSEFNKGFDAFSGAINKGVESVFAADNATVESSKKVRQARTDTLKAVQADGEAAKKSADEFQKFQASLAQSGADELKKLDLARADQLKKIDEFEKSRTATTEQASALRLEVEKQYADKRGEVSQKLAKEEKDRVDKQLAEYRQAVTEAANNPLRLVFDKIDLENSDFAKELSSIAKPFGKEIASSLGGLQSILNGRSGASSLVSNAAGMIGDAIVPGIGGAVSGITSLLAQGPDAVKAQVRGFIEAIPDIITAIAESIPVVVEALVDSLINEGGIVRIAVALAKAAAGEAIWKSLGKQLGIDMGTAFNGDVIAKKLSGGLTEGATRIGEAISKIFDFHFQWPALPTFSWPALPTFAWPALPAFNWPALPKFAWPALPAFSWPALPKFSWPALPAYPKFSWPALPSFSWPSLPSFSWPALPNIPDVQFPQPAWIEDFKAAIRTVAGGGGGGGGNSVINKAKSFFGLATGGKIPKGFPNDTYPAALTSDEGVLNVEQMRLFERMVTALEGKGDAPAAGASAAGGQLISIVLQVGEQQLAKTMLNINRQGYRTA